MDGQKNQTLSPGLEHNTIQSKLGYFFDFIILFHTHPTNCEGKLIGKNQKKKLLTFSMDDSKLHFHEA